jgi:hypothetical protein
MEKIMLRQLESPHHLFGQPFPGGFFFPFADSEPTKPRRSHAAPRAVVNFPHRPDASIINESIPLFYIGQNKKGRWVVRESEGRSGGLFLFKQWAVRFARRQSEPFGCAIMFLAEPIELDIDSQGRCAGPIPSAKSSSHSPSRNFATAFADVWRRFTALVSRNIAAQRRNRAAIERELFRGRYSLTSKQDDDLPLLP